MIAEVKCFFNQGDIAVFNRYLDLGAFRDVVMESTGGFDGERLATGIGLVLVKQLAKQQKR